MDLNTTNLVLDKTKCGDCVHYQVCYYRIQKKMPKMNERTVKVFDNAVKMMECEFYKKI